MPKTIELLIKNGIWKYLSSVHATNARKIDKNRDDKFYADLDEAISRFIGKTFGLALLQKSILPIRLEDKLYSDIIKPTLTPNSPPFVLGFFMIIEINPATEKFSAFDSVEEIALLISGSAAVNVTDWKSSTKYIFENAGEEFLALAKKNVIMHQIVLAGSSIVSMFWELMEEQEVHSHMLSALTGADRVLVCYKCANSMIAWGV